MRYTLPNGQQVRFKMLTDAEYDQARRIAPRSLNICPTCGGKEEYLAAGIKAFASKTYRYQGKEHPCNCSAQIALYSRYLLAGIGDQYMRLDWNDFEGDEEVDKVVRNYLENWEAYFVHGIGLMFSSPTLGVGKTWAASHIGKEMIKQRQKVVFTSFVQIVNAFCGDREEKRAMEVKMEEANLLIIDEIAVGLSDRQTDLFAMTFEVVIRHRTNFSLPTITTTNLTSDRFEQEFPRIASLLAPSQTWVDLNGSDYRKSEAYAEAKHHMAINHEMRPIT